MKLVSFTVENYRSITNARKIAFSDYTVLIGPNNEGKSNILRALALSMDALQIVSDRHSASGLLGSQVIRGTLTSRQYNRFDDFPIDLQDKHPDGSSSIVLEFLLDNKDIDDFYKQIGSKINDILPIRVKLGRRIDLSVPKQGKGQATLNKKTGAIAGFITERVRLEYIPAIRTADSAAEVISRLVEGALKPLESDPAYIEAVQRVEALQKPLLETLSTDITHTVKGFLPSVKSVDLEARSAARYRSLRRDVEITVNDGVATALSRKGDGIQSLVALAIMRHSAETLSRTAKSIIAIEEPESHLHPRAIHELRNVIMELSNHNQVVLTTHSPLFVNLSRMASNIIVNNKKAAPAKDVAAIRNILGVKLSDNLTNAELVLLVEGDDDKLALSSILSANSKMIDGAFKNNRFIVDSLNGSTNLSFKASFYINSACSVHCFLDGDQAGREAYEKASSLGYLDLSDVNFSSSPGLKEAEIEDLYDENSYFPAILEQYGVNLNFIKPSKKREKWSKRVESAFVAQGKPWNDSIKMGVKLAVAQVVSRDPLRAVLPAKAGPVSALIGSLEARLTKQAVAL